MKNFLKNLILPIAILTMLGSFANTALAVDLAALVVVFTPDPLFDEANFLPLDETSGTVRVTNNSGSEQTILTEAINVLDDNNFGSLLNLNIVGTSGTLFNNSLANFFSIAGEVPLGLISNGESKTFTYTVSFINSNNNTYQGKTLGFDVCVGFQGGNTRCGNTEIGGENPVDPNDPPGGGSGGTGEIPGSGGSGGGSGQFVQLVVFNESVLDIDEVLGIATIQWNTNLLATSQVIYGPVPPGGYALNTNILPNLGYPLGTIENGTKVLNHSVTLTSLAPGTYVYRVVSRASPPTVSVEHTFTMPIVGSGNLGTTIASAGTPDDTGVGEGLGDLGIGQLETTDSTSTEEAAATDNSNLLAFALGGLNFDLPGLVCVVVALVIFLVLLGLIWLIFKNKEKSISRDTVLLIVFGLIVSAILWFIPYTCPLIPFWIIVVIYIIWKLISKR